MRAAVTFLSVAVLLGCRGRATAPVPVPEDDSGGFLVPPPPAPPPPTQCRRTGGGWFRDPGPADAGDTALPAVEGVTLAADHDHPGTVWAAWADTRSAGMVLSRGRGRSAEVSVGAGEHSDPLLVLAGAVPAMVWVRQQGDLRAHEVVTGADLAGRCSQPEGVDDGMNVTAAPVQDGAAVLVAWDEDRGVDPAQPTRVTGFVVAQVVPVHGLRGICPAGRVLSPTNQDAGDPVAVPLAQGGAAVFWLASVTVEASDGNDTMTDVWGVAVDRGGVPRGAPVRVTSPPARRFGLAAHADPGGIWLAWRVAAESDNEGRGDGGDVAVTRLDPAVSRPGPVAVVTPDEANPSGAPGLVVDAHGAEVWWLDRRQESVVAVRRALDPASGQAVGNAMDEPAVGAELPAFRVGEEVTAVDRHGGGAGTARFRCPALVRPGRTTRAAGPG